MDFLTGKQRLLKITTLISFSLLIINGGKIAGFMFLYFIIMPFMVLIGAGRIDFGFLDPKIWSVIFIVYSVLVWTAVVYLSRSSLVNTGQRKRGRYSALALLVIFVPALFVALNRHNGIAEFVMLAIFFLSWLLTVATFLLKK